jgi:hypothetical protein
MLATAEILPVTHLRLTVYGFGNSFGFEPTKTINMKKLLLVCMLSLGMLTANAIPNPVINAYWSVTRGCINHITVNVSSPGTYKLEIHVMNGSWIGQLIYQTYFFSSAQPVSLWVTPSGPTNYYFFVMDMSAGNTLYPSSTIVGVYPPCSIRKIEVNNHDWTARTIQVGPQDPAEPVDGMEYKWSLEELNPETWESLYTIDNPGCWASSNAPGVSNSFPGFNNETTNYNGVVTELPCDGDDGILASDRLYRVTRYYRMPGEEEWQGDQLLIGPGYHEDGGARIGGADPATAAVALETIDVFPNPTNGIFTIQLNGTVANVQAEMINVLGERVDAFIFSGSTYNYSPATKLSPGIYMLRMTSNGVQFSKRIVVE